MSPTSADKAVPGMCPVVDDDEEEGTSWFSCEKIDCPCCCQLLPNVSLSASDMKLELRVMVGTCASLVSEMRCRSSLLWA